MIFEQINDIEFRKLKKLSYEHIFLRLAWIPSPKPLIKIWLKMYVYRIKYLNLVINRLEVNVGYQNLRLLVPHLAYKHVRLTTRVGPTTRPIPTTRLIPQIGLKSDVIPQRGRFF